MRSARGAGRDVVRVGTWCGRKSGGRDGGALVEDDLPAACAPLPDGAAAGATQGRAADIGAEGGFDAERDGLEVVYRDASGFFGREQGEDGGFVVKKASFAEFAEVVGDELGGEARVLADGWIEELQLGVAKGLGESLVGHWV